MGFAIFLPPPLEAEFRSRGAYSIPQSAAPHTTESQPPARRFTFPYVWERLYLSTFSFGRRLPFARCSLFGRFPEMLFQVHAKFYERDAFTFEQFSLKQGVRPANEDFAAVTDDAVPRNPFSRGSSGHGASRRARAAGQA